MKECVNCGEKIQDKMLVCGKCETGELTDINKLHNDRFINFLFRTQKYWGTLWLALVVIIFLILK